MTFADRIYSNVTIGGSGTDPAKRLVQRPEIESGGWRLFIDTHIRPQIEWGCRRFVIACPGGFTGPFEMGQMIAARDGVKGVNPPLPWLVNDFTTAWASLIKEQARKGEPIEVIPYVGAGAADAELDPAKTTLAQREHYRYDALNKLLRGGNALGLDALTLIDGDSEQGLYIRHLAASGRPIYGEGYPSKKNAWTAQLNVYCTESNYNQRTWGNGDYTEAEGGWGVPETDIKGRLVIIYDEGTEDGIVPFARRHLAAGRCVSLPLWALVGKVEMEDLDPAAGAN
jgi:hypothetical protein